MTSQELFMFAYISKAQCQTVLYCIIVIAALANPVQAEPSIDKLPYVGLREDRGYLTLVTSLPAGRGNFSAIDEQGLSLQGFVQVTENGADEKQVRLFRLLGRKAIGPPDDNPHAPALWVGFSATLTASPSPDHFTLRFHSTSLVASELQEEEAVLGRTCCGYHLSVRAHGDDKPVVVRGRRLTDLMIESAETYQGFERLAALCCRPGFEFVPASRFSPTLVAKVVDHELLQPDHRQREILQKAVQDLDSDQLAVRDAASDTLLAQGQTTSLWLESVAVESLSAEQQMRLRRVRAELAIKKTPLPFGVSAIELRSLTDAPPSDWIARLRKSSNDRVRDWAVQKLQVLSAEDACQTTSEW